MPFEAIPFKKFVWLARKAIGYTLERAAEEIGCSKSYVWELENGKSEPSLRIAAKIAKAYAVDLNQIAASLNFE
jgi:transcriptional regulator with XRE-family HTH domain